MIHGALDIETKCAVPHVHMLTSRSVWRQCPSIRGTSSDRVICLSRIEAQALLRLAVVSLAVVPSLSFYLYFLLRAHSFLRS